MMEPSQEAYEDLIRLRIAELREGKYVFSGDFTESVEAMKRKPLGLVEQSKLSRSVVSNVVPDLVGYGKQFKSKAEVKMLVVAYCCMVYHVKRLKLKQDFKAGTIYAVYYMNREDN